MTVVLTAFGLGTLAPVAHADTATDTTTIPSASTTTATTSTTTTTTTTVTTATTLPPAPIVTAPNTLPPSVPAPVVTVATTLPPATTVAPIDPAPAPQHVTAYPSQIANILATIRYLESRGNYTAPPNRGRASGAYQFITSTWNRYGGYADAYLAPPEVQDERAAADVIRILEQWNNDVSMVPVMWYYPRASREPALMDIVPVPSAGNVLTVREYQQRWLGVWAFTSGQPIPTPLTLGDAIARMGFAPEIEVETAAATATDTDPAVDPGERTATIAFPVLGPTRVAAPDCGDGHQDVQNADERASTSAIEAAGLCADQAPGIVFGVKLQPVLAPVTGVVTAVEDTPGSVISVTITEPTGRSYELAGFNDDNPGTDDGAAPDHLRLTSLARVGAVVHAGQVIGFMGDTDPLPIGVRSDVPTDATISIPDDAIAPHIRLTIVDLDGTPVDAYGPVIDALFRQVCTVGIGPWSGTPNGAGHAPVTIETTDDDREIDSEWVITPTGEVIASGWAAMIYPAETCGWAPADKRGPGAGGPTEVPDRWLTPVDLATSIWVELAVRNDPSVGVPVIRR